MKNRNILNYCEPEEVKEAMQRPEAKLMQCFSKIEYSTRLVLVRPVVIKVSFCVCCRNFNFGRKNRQRTQMHSLSVTIRRFLANWILRMISFEVFAEKHAFISQSFSSTSISICLTVLLFQEKSYMGNSQQSILYTSRMLEQLGSLQQAVRSTFMVVRDISLRDTIDPESANTEASESKVMRFLKSTYLGSEGVCLVRFAKMTYMDLADVMSDKGLEAFVLQIWHVCSSHFSAD